MDQEVEARFWPKVDFNGPDGCWFWFGALIPEGYGQIGIAGKNHMVHRVAYEHLVGPIPKGLHIDHLCRVTNCVNPEHLEPVTNAENQRRGTGAGGINFRKTHCYKGHPFDAENTYRKPSGERCCRICKNDVQRWARARRRARQL